MALIHSEDQLILKETARSFLGEKSPVERMRALRDSEDDTGFSRALWKEMAEMGWTGILFPEELGGAGMGYGELGVVLEECGRVLAPEPFVFNKSQHDTVVTRVDHELLSKRRVGPGGIEEGTKRAF